ncbi:glucan synthase-like 8 [Perilla frutescens var. hirtella]|uniref:Glucan synthase-like 8 n=1 Tax=Perilla frutescens var. hirtella TaxID=608512 RepID=A0AAD4INS0_PERFH|nr:glucan synthase-like 8 [Perilla frutescens var. hirtella]KAH6786411.1 glucan synthase-like 8 [Perilla frutescens var. hirtella]
MPKVYDDWERLVRATVRREELWQLCHEHSRTPSGGSTTSSSSSPKIFRSRVSPLNQQQPELSTSKSETPERSQQKVLKKGKSSMRRSKSIMRLDRWVWTRWLSNSFVPQHHT